MPPPRVSKDVCLATASGLERPKVLLDAEPRSSRCRSTAGGRRLRCRATTPVHKWPQGKPRPASGRGPEHRSRKCPEAKRVEVFRGTFVGNPFLPWRGYQTALAVEDYSYHAPRGDRRFWAVIRNFFVTSENIPETRLCKLQLTDVLPNTAARKPPEGFSRNSRTSTRRLSENRIFSKSLVCKLLIYKGLIFHKL